MKKICFIACLFTIYSVEAQYITAPLRLRTSLLLHPDKVSRNGFEEKIVLKEASVKPDTYQVPAVFGNDLSFSWELPAGVQQSVAFRILVASSPALLSEGKTDIWDSKKVNSTGNRLFVQQVQWKAGACYYWKVKYWDKKNSSSFYSDPQSFSIARGNGIAQYPLQAAIQYPVSIQQLKDNSWFIDFGKDAFSQVSLHITSDVSDSIWIEAAEALDAPMEIRRQAGNIRYTKRSLFVEKGTHDYNLIWPPDAKRNSRSPVQMPGYIGEVFPFRYVVVSGLKGMLDQSSVSRKMISYPFDEQASYFHSSDTVLNKVWELCKYSVKATSFTGNYVDGDRERVPYEADALINQLSHYAVDAEYSMARKSMEYVIFHPTWPTEWSLQNILLAWNDYLYTGDDSFLRKYYTELQQKILMPLAGKNGLITTTAKPQTDSFLHTIHIEKIFDGKRGLKDNVDWPHRSGYVGPEKQYDGENDGFVYTDYNSVVNAFYYRSLVLMNRIAAVLGKKEDALFYEKKSDELRKSYTKVFIDPQSGLVKDGDTTSHSSLHANMFALCFGLVPEENKKAVLQLIRSKKMACSVYGSQFLLDALYDAGEDEYALSLMNATTERSWYNMIRVGSTITMEAWDKKYKPNLDLNHAWGSAPANIIVRKLMGVEPLSPGADTIRIRPQTGSLSSAVLKTTLITGAVKVSVEKNKNTNTYEVETPGLVTAMIELPFDPQKTKLSLNGKFLQLQPVNGFYQLSNLPSGKYVFTMK